ncbi:MAG: family N-acetyltransferase [Candidatus Eremiobacteraeota bacterium]|nr:family N-acetyltransferase [Candidatus Eremiobacteraeota bacterium]
MNAPITIRPLDPTEWRALREIRLFALQTEPGVFFASYDGELALGDDEWQRRIAGAGCIVFGLFAGSDLVGITGVVADRDDPTGKTAVLVMSYIRPAYRGRGLTTLFYDARLGWIASQPQFTRVVVSHRASNEASGRAVRAHGFILVDRVARTWPDGTTDDEVRYTRAI